MPGKNQEKAVSKRSRARGSGQTNSKKRILKKNRKGLKEEGVPVRTMEKIVDPQGKD